VYFAQTDCFKAAADGIAQARFAVSAQFNVAQFATKLIELKPSYFTIHSRWHSALRLAYNLDNVDDFIPQTTAGALGELANQPWLDFICNSSPCISIDLPITLRTQNELDASAQQKTVNNGCHAAERVQHACTLSSHRTCFSRHASFAPGKAASGAVAVTAPEMSQYATRLHWSVTSTCLRENIATTMSC